jgi:L-fuculokinase
MQKKKGIAIFDIGKTNKKFYVFDQTMAILHEEQRYVEEIVDDEGFPCDDLPLVTSWMLKTIHTWMHHDEIDIVAINFTTYGATLAHIDEHGELTTPVYNYLKPIDTTIFQKLYDQFGESEIQLSTGAPFNAMLNSGLHLYWLKSTKPEAYKNTKHSLHLPQYLHYCVTNQFFADYTSIGCHTSMWDIQKNAYHKWMLDESLTEKLPDAFSPYHSIIGQNGMKIGIGIHDSSSALCPYLTYTDKSFLLISTGTWAISLNPFYEGEYLSEDMAMGCLNYLRPDGKPVRASRLFLGKEHEDQVHHLAQHFNVEAKDVPMHYDDVLYNEARSLSGLYFDSIHTGTEKADHTLGEISDIKLAYHRLSIELAQKQVEYIEIAIKDTDIKEIYIDGGFIHNKIYLKYLCDHYSDLSFFIAESPIGTALGAALMVIDEDIDFSKIQNFKVVQIQ